MAPEKTVGPATVLQFAGITLDSVRQEGRLPEGKLRTCCAMLQNFHDQARLSVCLKELTPVTDRFIEFYMPRGCLGSSFSASHDRSYQRRRQDHLTFNLQRMSIPLFALLQPYISIVISGEIAPGHFYVTLIKLPFLFTNSMSHFSSADLTVDSSRYKSHSFRIGGACHAAEKGYSDAQIRALGRWKSYAFKVYLRSEVLHAN